MYIAPKFSNVRNESSGHGRSSKLVQSPSVVPAPALSSEPLPSSSLPAAVLSPPSSPPESSAAPSSSSPALSSLHATSTSAHAIAISTAERMQGLRVGEVSGRVDAREREHARREVAVLQRRAVVARLAALEVDRA